MDTILVSTSQGHCQNQMSLQMWKIRHKWMAVSKPNRTSDQLWSPAFGDRVRKWSGPPGWREVGPEKACRGSDLWGQYLKIQPSRIRQNHNFHVPPPCLLPEKGLDLKNLWRILANLIWQSECHCAQPNCTVITGAEVIQVASKTCYCEEGTSFWAMSLQPPASHS